MSSSSRQPSALGTFLLGSLMGFGIGGLLTLLLTPTSGKGIRRWVQQKMAECPCWKKEESPNCKTTTTEEVVIQNHDDPYENEVGY